jgi:hypothetical protein
MAGHFFQAGFVALFLLSAYGWGRLGRRFLDRRIFALHSLTTILGLTFLNVLGGMLNLAHLAKGWVLPGLLLLGIIIATREIASRRPWCRRSFTPGTIPIFVALAVTMSAAWMLVPAGLFNIHDDFHTYATRAVRMVQTGSIGGNPFDPLGLDSLGSQSFFHGFFLKTGGGLELLNGFDAVGCFGLCLWLVAELSFRWRLPWWLGVAAVLGLAWINPQSVNVSPLYSGIAGVMALAVCGSMLARSATRHTPPRLVRIAVAIGLFTGWLAALKITLAAFAACFVGCLFLLIWWKTRRRREIWSGGLAVILTVLLTTLPWALVSLPAMIKAGQASALVVSAPVATPESASLAAHEIPLLFRPLPLFYGNTPPIYAAIGATALALGLAGLAWCSAGARLQKSAGMLAVTAAGVAAALSLLLHSHLFPISTAIRYSCPVLIGGFLFVVPGFLRFRSRAETPLRWRLGGVMTLVLACVIVVFNGTFLRRIDTILRDRTLMAFPTNRKYASYCHGMQATGEAAYHQRLQAALPAGATALIWTVAPFHFDFARNPLLTVSEPGLINPALRFPAGLAAADLERYLRRFGIRYVLVEAIGYGVKEMDELEEMTRSRYAVDRRLGQYGEYLRRSLGELAVRGTVRHADGRMVLIELAGGDAAEPAPRNVTLHDFSSP